MLASSSVFQCFSSWDSRIPRPSKTYISERFQRFLEIGDVWISSRPVHPPAPLLPLFRCSVPVHSIAGPGRLQYTVEGQERLVFSRFFFQEDFLHFPELGTTAKLPRQAAAVRRLGCFKNCLGMFGMHGKKMYSLWM